MRLLFLDHDGVLCLPERYGSRVKKLNKYNADIFDVQCVKILNKISKLLKLYSIAFKLKIIHRVINKNFNDRILRFLRQYIKYITTSRRFI